MNINKSTLTVITIMFLLTACGGNSDQPENALTNDLGVPESDLVSQALIADDYAGELTHYVIIAKNSTASYTAEEEFFSGAIETIRKAIGIENAVGSTSQMEGQLYLGLVDFPPYIGPNEFIVDIRSLKSDESRRDQRIRERHLESNRFPYAVFVATSIEGFPAAWEEGQEISFDLVGELTVRKITQPFTFGVVATLDGDFLQGTGSGTLFTVDYGFAPPEIKNILIVTDGILITLDFEMQKVK